MQALRTNLQNSEAQQLSDENILTLCQEWKSLKSLENRSWFQLQIESAVRSQIIDINLLLSAFVNSITEWIDLILLGWILRLGANPNLYVQTPLGPAHILIYAIIQARKNKIANDVLIAMSCMFVVVADSLDISILNNPAYNTELIIKNQKESYNSKLVVEVNNKLNPSIIVSKTKIKESITIEKWLVENSIVSLKNIPQVLFSLGKTIPAIVGTCLDNKELAFMIENEIPSFEFVITCRAVEILKEYPMNNNGKHLYIKNGEVVGLVQSIDGALLEGFLLFLNSGVTCSYFLINRLCLAIAESINNKDLILTDILTEMLISYISIGGSLDLNQFNIIKLADGVLASSIEKMYNQPLWKKICSGNINIELPKSLKQLALILGLDPQEDKETLCAEFERITMADFDTLRDNAIARQRQRITNSTSSISGMKSFSGCSNGQQLNIIPEEYSDINMFYYRDGDNIFCYTSEMFENIILTKKDPTTKKKLDSSILNSISCQLKHLEDLGLDPLEPLSISQAILKLNEEDTINSKETNFAVQSIKQILMGQNYELLNINKINTEELNRILQSIKMEQELLPKLNPQHQLDTFYLAVYYALQIDSELSKVFLKTYKTIIYSEKITIFKNASSPVKKQEKIILIEEVGIPATTVTSTKEVVVEAPKKYVLKPIVVQKPTEIVVQKPTEIVVQPKKYVLVPKATPPPQVQSREQQQAAIITNQQALYRQQQQTIALQQKELQQKQEIAAKEAIAQQAYRDSQQQKAYALSQQQALLQQQAIASAQREQAVLAQQQGVINAQNQQLSQQQAVINSQKQKLSTPSTVTVKEFEKTTVPQQQVRFQPSQVVVQPQVIQPQVIQPSQVVVPTSYEYLPPQTNTYNVGIKDQYN